MNKFSRIKDGYYVLVQKVITGMVQTRNNGKISSVLEAA
jgi:hypothetical protein